MYEHESRRGGKVMKVAIGSDHGGVDMKSYIIANLTEESFQIVDCGINTGASVDYPDIAADVCRKVIENKADLGIIICGTGIGISIAANKIIGIRAALCHTEFSARMARQHNNANVLALGGRVLGNDLAVSIVRTFLNEHFSGEERHQRRIDKTMSIENKL
jgi:RpiB/LacA/LacB family sugar-phosphate isomerase